MTETAASAAPGGTITLTYGGAATGEKEYVSLLLCDSTGASVLRYGSSAALTSASGTASFTVPNDLALGSYTLKVFNEQRNGDYKADYASAFDEVTLTVTKKTITPAVTLVGWTYGETANTTVVTGNTDNGEVTFTYSRPACPARGASPFDAAVVIVESSLLKKECHNPLQSGGLSVIIVSIV